MIRLLLFSVLFITGISCHHRDQQASAANTVAPSRDSVKIYSAALVDSKKDPACGMPTTSGMEDTLHLNGKVIGFCSKECKAAYLKDPKQYPITYKK